MPKVKVEKILNVDRVRFFNTITNFENLPVLLPQFFKSVKTVSKDQNGTIAEEHVVMSGRDIHQKVKHVLNPPEVHEVFILEGEAKDSHIVERYETTDHNTKVTVDGDFQLAGKLKLLGFFAKKKIEKNINDILDEIAKILSKL